MFRPLPAALGLLLAVPSLQAVTVEVPSSHAAKKATPAHAAHAPVAHAKAVNIPARIPSPAEVPSSVIISVRDQKLMLLLNGARVATYPVSTSKYGLGDFFGSMATPLGYLQVADKIGDHAPLGAVFHNRRPTGEVLAPNAPGRDPITTRIIWLRGLESQNAHAFTRCIYIHGTAEEKFIGRPASYGCIRMKSADVAALYNQLPVGASVQIIPDKLPSVSKSRATVTGNPITAPPSKATPDVLLASGKGA